MQYALDLYCHGYNNKCESTVWLDLPIKITWLGLDTKLVV